MAYILSYCKFWVGIANTNLIMTWTLFCIKSFFMSVFLTLFVSHGGSLSSTSNVPIKICAKYREVSKNI